MKAIISLVLALHGIFCLTGPIHAQSQSTDRAKLIEDAKKEGKVMVYVSSNASDAKALKSAFEKKYPFINMEFLSSGKDALLSKYLLEVRTGTYLADVYQSSVFPIMNLLEKGLLARYYSPEREAYIEALRDKDGYWNGMYLNALTMAYNTRMLKPDEVPSQLSGAAIVEVERQDGFCPQPHGVVFRDVADDGGGKGPKVHGGLEQAKYPGAHRLLIDESAHDGRRVSIGGFPVSHRRGGVKKSRGAGRLGTP